MIIRDHLTCGGSSVSLSIHTHMQSQLLAFDQGQQHNDHEPSLASLACGGPHIPPLLPCSPAGVSPTSVVPPSIHSRVGFGSVTCSDITCSHGYQSLALHL